MGQPVVHFEVIGTDPNKLRGYYGELFGWEYDTSGPVPATGRRRLGGLRGASRPGTQSPTRALPWSRPHPPSADTKPLGVCARPTWIRGIVSGALVRSLLPPSVV